MVSTSLLLASGPCLLKKKRTRGGRGGFLQSVSILVLCKRSAMEVAPCEKGMNRPEKNWSWPWLSSALTPWLWPHTSEKPRSAAIPRWGADTLSHPHLWNSERLCLRLGSSRIINCTRAGWGGLNIYCALAADAINILSQCFLCISSLLKYEHCSPYSKFLLHLVFLCLLSMISWNGKKPF